MSYVYSVNDTENIETSWAKYAPIYVLVGGVREIRNSNDVVVASERHIYPGYFARIKK